MLTTTRYEPAPTLTPRGGRSPATDLKLLRRYEEISAAGKVAWMGHYHLQRLLGRGGQGEVYLSEYRGTDRFTVPVAIKIFSPERYETALAYKTAMQRVAETAARIAVIQHDNLLGVQNFIERSGIRMMMMEWIDGHDLRQLVHPSCLHLMEGQVSPRRWRYINEVILTDGPKQSRFKPGIAVAIVRECLSALAALHRQGVLHGDIKPANIMLKRTGHTKLIDIGSALDWNDPPKHRDCTPLYAPPEVLEERAPDPRSDLASLGYVLVELLAGRPVSSPGATAGELLNQKRSLPAKLSSLLPDEVQRNSLLMNFINGLINPDVNRRFQNAEIAEHVDQGAAAFHRQLVLGDMSTEYVNDVRVWLDELRRLKFNPDHSH